jgi:hypothetical protein
MSSKLITQLALLCLTFVIDHKHLFGQNNDLTNSFDQELIRLKACTAQVFGRDIEELPKWSDDSDVLFCKKEGAIYSINLKAAKLTVGVWHHDTIGVIRRDLIKPLTPKEKKIYNAKYKHNRAEVIQDRIQTKKGLIIKFVQRGLSTVLIKQVKDRPEHIEWTSGSVCGGIVLSPNEKYVAFYCETSGVFIMKVDQIF